MTRTRFKRHYKLLFEHVILFFFFTGLACAKNFYHVNSQNCLQYFLKTSVYLSGTISRAGMWKQSWLLSFQPLKYNENNIVTRSMCCSLETQWKEATSLSTATVCSCHWGETSNRRRQICMNRKNTHVNAFSLVMSMSLGRRLSFLLYLET